MTNKNAPLGALFLTLVCSTGAFARSPIPVSVSPVTVIGREMLERADASDLSDVLSTVPGITTGTDVSDTAINIRGLGTGRTLTLVNGSRPATTVDLNSIPAGLIERIEVLKDSSASAIYGSDAVAGVVNVVTRDDYEGFDVSGSWVLNGLQRSIGERWYTAESKGQCDATSGATHPGWAYFDGWKYGLPKIDFGGDRFYWNGRGEIAPRLDPSHLRRPPGKTQTFDLELNPDQDYTFKEFERLGEVIRNDPDAPEQDKRDYLGMLGFAYFGLMRGGGSDQAGSLGHFDVDKWYREFREWSAKRSEAERTEYARLIGSFDAPGVSGAPPAADSTPAPTPAETPTRPAGPVEGEPAETPAAAPPPPNPFDRYSYPPDYAFDFGVCSDEQKRKLLKLIDERDTARADHSYYMDYLRREYQAQADNQADDAKAQEALDTRDAKNEELRRAWLACVNPTSTASAGDQIETAPAVSRQTRGWDLEVHVYRDIFGEDGTGGTEPAPDVGFGKFDFNYGLNFKTPFTDGAIRDTELDAGAGSSRAFTDERGVARIKGAFGSTHLGRGPVLGGRYEDPDSAVDDALPAIRPGFGLGARASFDLDEDWQLGVDYDRESLRNGPTVGMRFKFQKYDSVYQEFLTQPLEAEQPADKDHANTEFDAGSVYLREWFSFGGKTYKSFFYPERSGLDSGWMDGMAGQTYWANNDCGDTALPPEGAGYLTADESPVKTPADHWAFDRVGLTGNEPVLDEFARPVIVAVVDTGLDWNHLDFAWENLWRNEDEIPGNGVDDDRNGYVDDVIGWSFTDESNRPWDNDGHGTAVAGIIAATQGNDTGIDGINGSTRIMVLKALNNFGRTRASFVARAIVYAADNGAQLINLSVSPGFPKIVQDAVDYAADKGILVVTAAGNNAEDLGTLDPGPLRNVLTVAAIDADDRRAVFSNVGQWIDIAAPGVDIVSLRARATDFMYAGANTRYVRGDAFIGDDLRYYRATGTSFAAPIVTGIASLLLANNPGLDPAALKNVLVQSARDVESPGVDLLTGYGIVDARAALQADPAFYVRAAIPVVQSTVLNGVPVVEVFGSAEADEYAGAVVEIGAGEDPDDWTAVDAPIDRPVPLGRLAAFPAAALAGAESWSVRLTVRHAGGESREARYLLTVAE